MDLRWCRRIPSIRSPSPRASPARPRNVNFAASSISFLLLFRFASLFRPRPSVRPCGNGGADFSSFEVRLRLQRRLPRSAPSVVRLLTGGGGGDDGGFGVDYFFRRRRSGRARQTLDLSAAPPPTATDAAVDRRPRERGQPRAKATMNSFPPSSLPPFIPAAPA